MFTIVNDFITVVISAAGAEIRSLRETKSKIEYIWPADSRYWAKSAPHLFPLIGELKNGKYRYKGKEYAMPKHGFARDLIFQVANQEKESLELRLQSNAYTKEVYPFNFELRIIYSLEGSVLSCRYEVFNHDATAMYFSLGAHPAFLLPLNGGNDFSNYRLVFDNDLFLERYFLNDGLISNYSKTVNLKAGSLQLVPDMFDADAWIMKDLCSRKIRLTNGDGTYVVDLQFEGFSNLGIWSVPGAPFICIEPCCGYNDAADATGDIENKGGVLMLPGKSNMIKNWSIQVYDGCGF